MRTEDLAEHLREQPFQPFRIYLSDGKTFDVRHPDMCLVSRSTAYVGIPDPRIRGAAMRVAHISLIHITRVEPLNGHPGGSLRRRRRGA
jgi:hypothetical protein